METELSERKRKIIDWVNNLDDENVLDKICEMIDSYNNLMFKKEFDWAIFLNNEFHPTFQKELSKQLFEKANQVVDLENFYNHDFQIIIDNSEIRLIENKVFTKIDLVTPGSFAIPVEICWTTEKDNNLKEMHKHDISGIKIDINWNEKISSDKILPYMDDLEWTN